MTRKNIRICLEIVSFIMIALLIIMILTAWNDLKPQVPLFYWIENQSMVDVNKHFILIPLILGLFMYGGINWLKRSKFLDRHIQGKDTLSRLRIKENWVFKLMICQSDCLIFCVLLELSMIARINVFIALSLILLMTILVIILQYRSFKELSIKV